MTIRGLTILRAALGPDEQRALLRWIDGQPWSDALRRRTQHYGWSYSYDRRALTTTDALGALPGPLLALARRLRDRFAAIPDQAIVNEYLVGQGIGAHIDHPGNFGPVVASISFGSSAVMQFVRAGERRDVALHPGDILILADEARTRWTHAIPSHDARRVSVTFRTVRIATR